MKIVHICCVSKKSNGIKSVLKELSVQQRQIGEEVKVLSLLSGEEDFIHIRSIKHFYSEISDSRPDIVVFHSVYYLLYIPFAIILSLKKIPYIIQLHGALSQENYKVSHMKKVVANLICFNKFIKNAKSIIYLNNNEYSKSIVKSINPRYVIIPNGCNHIPNLKLSKHNNDILTMAYVGRIDRVHKGLDVLLDAIDVIKNRQVPLRLQIKFYGDGEESELKWFKEQLASKFPLAEFLGPVYGREKDVVMRNAHMFILTSRYEGMPMSVLEALSYGLPCILTNETNLGIEVQTAGAGWLTLLDPQAIANTIANSEKEYRERSEFFSNNALRLAEKYSWRKIAKDSICHYKSIVLSH